MCPNEVQTSSPGLGVRRLPGDAALCSVGGTCFEQSWVWLLVHLGHRSMDSVRTSARDAAPARTEMHLPCEPVRQPSVAVSTASAVMCNFSKRKQLVSRRASVSVKSRLRLTKDFLASTQPSSAFDLGLYRKVNFL